MEYGAVNPWGLIAPWSMFNPPGPVGGPGAGPMFAPPVIPRHRRRHAVPVQQGDALLKLVLALEGLPEHARREVIRRATDDRYGADDFGADDFGADDFGADDDDGDDGDDFGADDFGADDFGADDFGAKRKRAKVRRAIRAIAGGGRGLSAAPYGMVGTGAPPQSGKLNEIPMYAAGQNTPLVKINTGGTGTSATQTLTAQQLSYAAYRVQAFLATAYGADAYTIPLVEDLIVAGYPNLFPVDSAMDARDFDKTKDNRVGLRFKPIVQPFNTTGVQVTAWSKGTANTDTAISAALAVDYVKDALLGRSSNSRWNGR